jgi:hypothetical protein
MSTLPSWQDLPHREVWVVDTEYFPGAGLANGGRKGDRITPLCLVALELRSGRLVRLWQDELGACPPYRLDADALFTSYFTPAEFGFHLALARGWGQPACALDAYIEFRHHTNDGEIRTNDPDPKKHREKGFYSLAGALRFFKEDGIDTAHKRDMRDRILQGPPFTADERALILDYCEEDTRALGRLVCHLIPTVRSLPHAQMRAQFAWATACQERRGVPLDLARLEPLRSRWGDIQVDLVLERDRFGFYEIGPDGKPHWNTEAFVAHLRRNDMEWIWNGDKPSLEQSTFREMVGRYPEFETVRELRYSLAQMRLNDLEVGHDGRNRTLLGPFGTKTGRNAPSNSGYIFGPAKWLRFMIAPDPGRALIHRDYCQQEPRIAAILSGDDELLHACESGDVYLGIAEQLGFLHGGMSNLERENVRAMFKVIVLAIQYGLGAESLAIRTGISRHEAREILARLRARYRKFEAYAAQMADVAGLELEIRTCFDWTMKCPSGMRPNTIRNFPVQATAAEILHVACILAERLGIEIVAPVHDALMAECDLDQVEHASYALDRVMRDAAAIVLRGYELPTDKQIIRPGQHYYDKRGAEMWGAVEKLLAKLEERRA